MDTFLLKRPVDWSLLTNGSFDFPNGLPERVKLNKHLLQA